MSTSDATAADRLRAAVKQAGSQARLAALIGVSQPAISRAVQRAAVSGHVSFRILYGLDRLLPPADSPPDGSGGGPADCSGLPA